MIQTKVQDTFKNAFHDLKTPVANYKLPVLTPQKESRLGIKSSNAALTTVGLSQLQGGTVPVFNNDLSSKEISSEEISSSDEPNSSWLPSLQLFTPNKSEEKPKKSSIYSQLRRIQDTGL